MLAHKYGNADAFLYTVLKIQQNTILQLTEIYIFYEIISFNNVVLQQI